MVAVILSRDDELGAACAAELAGPLGLEVQVVDHAAAIARMEGPVEVLVAITAQPSPGRPDAQPHLPFLVEVQEAFDFVVPAMVDGGSGRVVLVVSATGLPGQSYADQSAATAWGMVGLARAAARQVAASGVTINVVRCGLIASGDGDGDGSEVASVVAETPMRRAGTADDVAAAVGFLASPDASYVTGTVLPVDGGLTMGQGA